MDIWLNDELISSDLSECITRSKSMNWIFQMEMAGAVGKMRIERNRHPGTVRAVPIGLPLDRAATSHLRNRDLIRHGYLPSRTFHGRGRID